MEMMYELPSVNNVGICTITGDVVENEAEPELVYRDTTVPRKALTSRFKKDNTGEIA